jgi:peptidoglycan/xylan/chitin deacetylase (PgdA/CDA1 family)
VRVPILSYQPSRIDGNDYRGNDLKALASDLRQVSESGFRILPLATVADAWLDGRHGELEGKVVAFACDNGADFDYTDLPHPIFGVQRGVLSILRDFIAEHPGAQDAITVTSFVIASPEARATLDATCLVGKGWWTNERWSAAIATGLMHIGNHSWDYCHPTLSRSVSQGRPSGTFLTVDSEALADHEIRRAADYLRKHAPNPGTALFAYPYGQSNDFLVREYFPRHGGELGIRAAFTSDSGFLDARSERWALPRLRFGRDWSSPDELQRILDAASDTQSAWRPPPAPAELAGKEFAAFLEARVEPIPGWLNPEAALLTAHLAAVQRTLEISGPTVEIGVFRGKYLAVLYELSQPGEIVVGVDLFIGAPDMGTVVDLVRKNVAAACGEAERLKIVVADSMELTSERLAKEVGGQALRFVSIDGGHTKELVLRDLQSAYPLLARGGIMALDDVFNYTTPGVIEGIAEFFLRDKPALAPFAICYNKVFVTTPEFHARYLREAVRFLEETTWLPMHWRTLARRAENQAADYTQMMFGYEVVAFL